MNQNIDEVGKIAMQYHQTIEELIKVWRNDILFTWRWWFKLIFITIFPWIIWFIVKNKKDTHRLLYAGFFITIVASFLDMAGAAYGLWYYPYKLVPFLPQYVSWDFSAMPVITMLFYQFKPEIKPWIKAIVYSFVSSFVVEPIAVWLGLYKPIFWPHWLSFLIVFGIYMAGYYLYKKSGDECRDSSIKLAK